MENAMKDAWIVLTTINPPTRAVAVIAELCRRGWSCVVVGDTKTPSDWHCDGIDYLDVAAQRRLFGAFADAVPYRHYCRKNLGYLYAIRRGARLILETDDDNIPYDTFGLDLRPEVGGRLLRGPGWVNVYRHFTDDPGIWPRGLPLDAIHEAGSVEPLAGPRPCPVQQYLADNDPDVDAVYRLTRRGSLFFDRPADPVVLDADAWTPFNSQNTLFYPEAFPLLYLPCHVSFRMTDIWRSFVAQAALAHHGLSVAFHPPTVEQLRNAHDLMRDFQDEVVGYLRNREIAEALTAARRGAPADDPARTAARLWDGLREIGVLPEQEMPLVKAWFEEVAAAARAGGQARAA
jgi:hypothetical protein